MPAFWDELSKAVDGGGVFDEDDFPRSPTRLVWLAFCVYLPVDGIVHIAALFLLIE